MYLTNDDGARCGPLLLRLQELVNMCTGEDVVFSCNPDVVEGHRLIETVADTCLDTVGSVNAVISSFTRGGVEAADAFGCSGKGLIKDLSGGCGAMELLNEAVEQFQEGTFSDCVITTQTTTGTSTDTSTATTTESTTPITTVTSTQTTTVTSTPWTSRLECFASGGADYVGVEAGENCGLQAGQLNALLTACADETAYTERFQCTVVGGRNVIAAPSLQECVAALPLVNEALVEYAFPLTSTELLSCTVDGFLKSEVGCAPVTDLDRAVHDHMYGTFTGCKLTTPTTTQTTTPTSTPITVPDGMVIQPTMGLSIAAELSDPEAFMAGFLAMVLESMGLDMSAIAGSGSSRKRARRAGVKLTIVFAGSVSMAAAKGGAGSLDMAALASLDPNISVDDLKVEVGFIVSSLTTTATTTATSTPTTSMTSTVTTSPVNGDFICETIGASTYINVAKRANCVSHAVKLNDVIRTCDNFNCADVDLADPAFVQGADEYGCAFFNENPQRCATSSEVYTGLGPVDQACCVCGGGSYVGEHDAMICEEDQRTGTNTLTSARPLDCPAISDGLNSILERGTMLDSPGIIGCSIGGYLTANNACEAVVDTLNSLLNQYQDGTFEGCSVSTQTTTAATTVTTTATTTPTSTTSTTTTSTQTEVPEITCTAYFYADLISILPINSCEEQIVYLNDMVRDCTVDDDLVTTVLRKASLAGDLTLDIVNHNYFQVGDEIVIAAGTEVEEFNVVAGFASLILTTPLQFDHPAGTTVTRIVPVFADEELGSGSGESSDDDDELYDTEGSAEEEGSGSGEDGGAFQAPSRARRQNAQLAGEITIGDTAAGSFACARGPDGLSAVYDTSLSCDGARMLNTVVSEMSFNKHAPQLSCTKGGFLEVANAAATGTADCIGTALWISKAIDAHQQGTLDSCVHTSPTTTPTSTATSTPITRPEPVFLASQDNTASAAPLVGGAAGVILFLLICLVCVKTVCKGKCKSCKNPFGMESCTDPDKDNKVHPADESGAALLNDKNQTVQLDNLSLDALRINGRKGRRMSDTQSIGSRTDNVSLNVSITKDGPVPLFNTPSKQSPEKALPGIRGAPGRMGGGEGNPDSPEMLTPLPRPLAEHLQRRLGALPPPPAARVTPSGGKHGKSSLGAGGGASKRPDPWLPRTPAAIHPMPSNSELPPYTPGDGAGPANEGEMMLTDAQARELESEMGHGGGMSSLSVAGPAAAATSSPVFRKKSDPDADPEKGGSAPEPVMLDKMNQNAERSMPLIRNTLGNLTEGNELSTPDDSWTSARWKEELGHKRSLSEMAEVGVGNDIPEETGKEVAAATAAAAAAENVSDEDDGPPALKVRTSVDADGTPAPALNGTVVSHTARDSDASTSSDDDEDHEVTVVSHTSAAATSPDRAKVTKSPGELMAERDKKKQARALFQSRLEEIDSLKSRSDPSNRRSAGPPLMAMPRAGDAANRRGSGNAEVRRRTSFEDMKRRSSSNSLNGRSPSPGGGPPPPPTAMPSAQLANRPANSPIIPPGPGGPGGGIMPGRPGGPGGIPIRRMGSNGSIGRPGPGGGPPIRRSSMQGKSVGRGGGAPVARGSRSSFNMVNEQVSLARQHHGPQFQPGAPGGPGGPTGRPMGMPPRNIGGPGRPPVRRLSGGPPGAQPASPNSTGPLPDPFAGSQPIAIRRRPSPAVPSPARAAPRPAPAASGPPDPSQLVKLRQAYANGLASMQAKKGLAAKDVFRSLDVQGSGTMTKDAFFVGARITGVAINRQQADQLFNSLDLNGTSGIDADTFASLTGGTASELTTSGRDPFARLPSSARGGAAAP